MKWLSNFVVQEDMRNAVQVEKPVHKTCTPENREQSGFVQVYRCTGEKQQKGKKVCEAKSQTGNLETEIRSDHEAWRITLRPVPKHICRKLCPEEEKHLRNFIKTKLVVAHRRGDTFYHMSGSDLWRLQGEYERATGFEFSMRIDFFDHYVAQATGAQVMQSPDGQVWLVGVSYC